MKKYMFIICCLLALPFLRAQLSLSYYPLSSYVGISSNPDLRGWIDLRILGNTFISNTNMELLPMLNLRKDSVVKYYIGAGINFNLIYGLYNEGRYINGYVLAFGTRVSPFRAARNLSFIAELSPYVNETLIGATLRSHLGLAWRFAGKR